MKFLQMPPIDRLKELLSYCPDAGIFTWNKTLSNRTKAGEKAGSPNSKGYVSIKIDGKQYKAHRLAWYCTYNTDPGEFEIDHKDLDKGNNRILNLRLVTRKQNNENTPKQCNNTSGVRGVFFHKGYKRWVAYIYHNKKRIHLGNHKEFDDAVYARKEAEKRLFTHIGIGAPKE